MKTVTLLIIIVSLQVCYAPPVTQNKKEGESEDSEINGLEDYMEYHRYLKEVVNALESDPDFRAKLEKADEKDIKSGKIAEELEFVSHHVRTRLDEIKRVELERLKELVEKKRQLEDPNSIIDDPTHHHIDHANPHTFEIEDLKKLIAKTTSDLAEADRKRKEQFKQYEMEKEYKKQDKLNHTTGAEREKLEKELKEMEEKHKKHEKLHEPGHKAQLEEVWEEQDQMQQDFDPKTFFMLHDLDGNGLWDQDEVKALFIKELDKMYQQGHPEDDMRERAEEMERMRETVFQEMDTNQDGFIDFNEFMRQTNTNDFKQDHGWQSLDEQKPYTDEELAEYIRYHQANQPGGYQHIPQGGYQGLPQGYQQPPNAVHQQVQPGYPGGYQAQGYQQPQTGYHHQQAGYQQPYGGYQQQQQGGYQQAQGGYQQPPHSGNHPNAIPQANSHQGQQVHYDQNYLNTNEIHQQYPQGQQQVYQSQQQNPQSQQQVPHSQQQQVPQSQQQVPQFQQQQVPQSQQQVPQSQQQVPQSQQQQVPQSQQQVPQSQQQPVPQSQQQQVPQVQQPQVPQTQQQQQAPQVVQQSNLQYNQQPNVQPPQVQQQQHHP